MSTAEPRVAESSEATTARRLSNQEKEMAEAAAGILIDTIMPRSRIRDTRSRGGAGPRGSARAALGGRVRGLVKPL